MDEGRTEQPEKKRTMNRWCRPKEKGVEEREEKKEEEDAECEV